MYSIACCTELSYIFESPGPNVQCVGVLFSCAQVTVFTQYLYDAVYLYLKIIDKILLSGGDFRDSATVVQNSVGVTFTGKDTGASLRNSKNT